MKPAAPMRNACVFSPDRRHRYTLIHRWDELLAAPEGGRGIAWIALNPSTADENQLDPTLRRIRDFSITWGYDFFVMLNAFAWRDTDPAGMKAAPDPVGPDNDHWIAHWSGRVDRVVVAWGEHGAFRDRHREIVRLLDPRKTVCLARNASGQPKHPLYVARATRPVPYTW
jgi:hypothetical protein